MAKQDRATPAYVRLIITIVAGLLTIALTGIAFWLSYEHLHDVAAQHGLNGVRAWAWPATLDTFIVIGEALMLRGSLTGKWDWWAVGLMMSGSVGSIVLNVTGVGSDRSVLDYVVAAVPPVAALLAFGALMRQLHQAIKAYMDAGGPEIIPGSRTVPPGVVTFDDDETERTAPAEPDTFPYTDAMRYEAGDENGLDADLDALRGVRLDVSGVPDDVNDTPEIRERVAALPDGHFTVPAADVPDIWTAPPGTPEPDPMMPSGLPDAWRRQLSVVPDVPVNGVPVPVSLSRTVSPDTDTRTRDNGGQRAGSVRPAVRPSVPSRRRTSGLAARVRDMAEDNKSDAEIKEELSGENPDSVRRTINRVRKERGEIT